jgi:NifB/MoaA-like Fe-S oxidoreductase
LRKLFLADEFFIKAKRSIPARKYYEDYPQIENGIGLVRQLLEEWKSVKKEIKSGIFGKKLPGKSLLISSVSASGYLETVLKEARKILPALDIEMVPVVNNYFGESVTVAGLMTAADVIGAVKEKAKGVGYKNVLLPGVMFNYAGHTLDGFSPERISKALGLNVQVVDSLGELFGKKQGKSR